MVLSLERFGNKAADLSKSLTHKGALGEVSEAGRGIGLRFPFSGLFTTTVPIGSGSSSHSGSPMKRH